MRITEHPILDFKPKSEVNFIFDGINIKAYENETIAVALHAAGIRILSLSQNKMPRGLYCAIGNCSSCNMVVDGEPNVRSCVTVVREGMVVQTQRDKGKLP